jgi:hypothetical protein
MPEIELLHFDGTPKHVILCFFLNCHYAHHRDTDPPSKPWRSKAHRAAKIQFIARYARDTDPPPHIAMVPKVRRDSSCL